MKTAFWKSATTPISGSNCTIQMARKCNKVTVKWFSFFTGCGEQMLWKKRKDSTIWVWIIIQLQQLLQIFLHDESKQTQSFLILKVYIRITTSKYIQLNMFPKKFSDRENQFPIWNNFHIIFLVMLNIFYKLWKEKCLCFQMILRAL